MLIFAICLCCAGAVLSFFARFPVLVAVTLLVALIAFVGGALSMAGRDGILWLLGAVVVSTVALQVGFGLGVIAKACLRPAIKAQRNGQPDQPVGRLTPSEVRRQVDSSRGV